VFMKMNEDMHLEMKHRLQSLEDLQKNKP
jgi:hypothetical protein